MLGRDIFSFILADNGKLYPAYGKDYAIWYRGSNWATSEYYWKYDDLRYCNADIPNPYANGAGCAARIIENGWVMDY